MIDDVHKVQTALEDSIAVDVNMLDRELVDFSPQIAGRLLQDLANIWSKKYVQRYKQLGDYLFVKYLDGNVKREKDGKFERSPYGMPVTPKFPGYNERYHRSIIDETGTRLQVKEPKISQK